jgi:poly(3-hydroxybutyrate) depolymerase
VHILAVLAAAFVLPGFARVTSEPDGGQLLMGTFPGTVRPGFVYLPPGFNMAQRYPVVYLLHGLPGSPSEYVDGTQLGAFADAQISMGALRPFIAVLPAAGTTPHYAGEWAGPWETRLVDDVVPWVDANLPTDASQRGRTIAGLSAGGFGAVDIALHHPRLFGTAESWSGYFKTLRDGPFKHADRATLAVNDPTTLARSEAPVLRRDGVRFFLSTGPPHSRRINPGGTSVFADELHRLRLPVAFRRFSDRRGEWREQVDAGLLSALAAS